MFCSHRFKISDSFFIYAAISLTLEHCHLRIKFIVTFLVYIWIHSSLLCCWHDIHRMSTILPTRLKKMYWICWMSIFCVNTRILIQQSQNVLSRTWCTGNLRDRLMRSKNYTLKNVLLTFKNFARFLCTVNYIWINFPPKNIGLYIKSILILKTTNVLNLYTHIEQKLTNWMRFHVMGVKACPHPP